MSKFFPTERALSLAQRHESDGQYYTHQEIAEEILEEMIHPDDWRAAAIQIEGLDEAAEDGDTLDRLSHIDEVVDCHYGLK